MYASPWDSGVTKKNYYRPLLLEELLHQEVKWKSGFPLNMIFDVCHGSLCVFDIMRADAVQSLYDTKPEKSAFDVFF